MKIKLKDIPTFAKLFRQNMPNVPIDMMYDLGPATEFIMKEDARIITLRNEIINRNGGEMLLTALEKEMEPILEKEVEVHGLPVFAKAHMAGVVFSPQEFNVLMSYGLFEKPKETKS